MTKEEQPGQAFHGRVGQAVQAQNADINDQSVSINAETVHGGIAGRDVVHHHFQSRLLTRQERRDLNTLVQRLDTGFGEPAKMTWRWIHDILGVDNIEGMHLEHLEPAETILQLLLENAELRSSAGTGDLLPLRVRLEESEAHRAHLTKHNADLLAQARTQEKSFADLQGRYNKRLAESEAIHRSAVGMRTTRNVSLIMALVVAGVAAFFWHQAHTLASPIPQAVAPPTECTLNGKQYAIGSAVDGPGSPHIKCVVGADGSAPGWVQLKPHRARYG